MHPQTVRTSFSETDTIKSRRPPTLASRSASTTATASHTQTPTQSQVKRNHPYTPELLLSLTPQKAPPSSPAPAPVPLLVPPLGTRPMTPTLKLETKKPLLLLPLPSPSPPLLLRLSPPSQQQHPKKPLLPPRKPTPSPLPAVAVQQLPSTCNVAATAIMDLQFARKARLAMKSISGTRSVCRREVVRER